MCSYVHEYASYATLSTSEKRISRGITIRYWIHEPRKYIYFTWWHDRLAVKTEMLSYMSRKKIENLIEFVHEFYNVFEISLKIIDCPVNAKPCINNDKDN